jgi:hypothetical protein
MIISLKKQITQLVNPVILNQQAKVCGFIQRVRAVKPAQLLAGLVNAMSLGHANYIADLHRQFDGIQLDDTDFVFYKPFPNQIRKPGFPLFMACITRHAMALKVWQCATQTGGQPLTEAEALAQRPKPYGADITFVTRGPRSGACA